MPDIMLGIEYKMVGRPENIFSSPWIHNLYNNDVTKVNMYNILQLKQCSDGKSQGHCNWWVNKRIIS
jgi:hypothetical protein